MEDFVTFEIAKKLKEKGFIGNGEIGCCCGFYCEEGFDINIVYDDLDNSELLCNEYLRPSISQVLKWFREKGIHAQIEISPLGWYGTLYTFSKDEKGLYDINDSYICIGDIYDNYEKAALCTIEYVLNNLI